MTNRARLLLSLPLLGTLLVGCKADPAKSVGFADPTLLKHDPNTPFHKFWRKPDVDFAKYKKIYIADVNTAYMLKITDWQKGERKDQIEKDVQTLRVYTHDSLAKAFRDDKAKRLSVIDSPTSDPDALVFEMALIEVVPSKVVLNALGYTPFFIGTGIQIVRSLAKDQSTAAMEVRVKDAHTGDVVMLAADRQAQQVAIIDVKGLTWYSEAHSIVDDWGKKFVEIVNKKPGEKVEARSGFRLLPW